MASYRSYGYQYETSPKKLQPEYTTNRTRNKKTNKNIKRKNNISKTQKTTKVGTKRIKKDSPDLRKKNVNKAKKNTKYNYKPIVYIAFVFVMLFVISYRYSLINETYNEKENIKLKVSEMQKKNEQMKVSIQNSLNLNTVEKAASDKLGMQKLDNSQKVYLNLKKKDFIEPVTEEIKLKEEPSWFVKLIKNIIQLIK